MRKEDHEHIAQCCISLQGLVTKNGEPEPDRTFSPDEFHRFIDRLVWAINASPGGRWNNDQKADVLKKIEDVLNSCARSSEPNKIIAPRMLEMFEQELAVLEDQRLDFDAFVNRCKGNVDLS